MSRYFSPEDQAEYQKWQNKKATIEAENFIETYERAKSYRKYLYPGWMVAFVIEFFFCYADWISPERWNGIGLAMWFVIVLFGVGVGLAPFFYWYAWIGSRQNRRWLERFGAKDV